MNTSSDPQVPLKGGAAATRLWHHPAVLLGGFGIAVVMLAAVGAAAYQGLNKFEARVASVERTQQIFIVAQDVLTLLKDGVIAQRGFLLTGEARYLEPYEVALRHRDERMAALRSQLVLEGPEQQARLAEIEALTHDVVQSIRNSVELRLRGVDARSADQIALIDAGKKSLDRARVVVKDIRTAANTELMDRLHEAEQTGSGTKRLLLVTDTIALTLLLVAFGLLRRQLIERRRAEVQLQRLNNDLELRISERTSQLEHANQELSGKVAGETRARAEVAELNMALERRVGERTAELALANQGLERFAYSVSHDLRTPLRAIVGFTRTLEREHGDALDDEGRRLIAVVLDSGRRMDRLIEDLLSFSRLRRKTVAAELLDMHALASQALRDVESSRGEVTKATVHIADLLSVRADRSLIWEVWTNLVSNALKFSSGRAAPQIEIGSRREGADCVYWVRDNGVGFNMKYYDRLFGVFERLHDAEEFPGTGVGLAIVHGAIDKHHGKVWAESRLGEGTTFYFALPSQGVSA